MQQQKNAQTKPKSVFPELEDAVLEFWKENGIFERSVGKEAPNGEYVFYDGPPFATGTPHYGHLVGSIMKDAVPRFWTMNGYRVERKWGWDCHGLPIENIVEKEMGSKSKKDIEAVGVAEFNERCRSKVSGYVDEWKKTITKLGRWADMDNAYQTMDRDYMESIWWVFKTLWDKDLIYQDYKSMHICPRCETTLSQQEVAEGYKDVKDLSVTAKFKVTSEKLQVKSGGEVYMLAWTTTPWTLPGNVALAVGKDIEYVLVRIAEDTAVYVLAKERLVDVMNGKEYENVGEVKGSDLVGLEYEPPFDYYINDKKLKNRENGWKVYHADFVTAEEGTGIAHEAPAFGADDWELLKQEDLPFVQHVNFDGTFKDEVTDFKGLHVKPIEDVTKTDVEIIKYLAHKGLLFDKQKYEHSYPHCWRCDTPLINYATSSWFVKVTGVKEKALELAKDISWTPANLKEGRFGKWLEGARDWSVSRQRFWASVMPVWHCNECDRYQAFGSVKEIEERMVPRNTFYFTRHGESEKNTQDVISADPDRYPLTEKGKAAVLAQAAHAKEAGIDIIVSSDVLRCRETAAIIARELGVEVVIDARLTERNFGVYEEQKLHDPEPWAVVERSHREPAWAAEGAESTVDVERRALMVWSELNYRYAGKTILLVSHGDVLHILNGRLAGRMTEALFAEEADAQYPEKGLITPLSFTLFDLHKHVVDAVQIPCEKCSGLMQRIPDVLDTWFDSGSMPYAQMHYPFENKEKFEQNFPAEFIAEGVDQTRAWFYYLHVLGAALKEKPAFKNVVVNGIVLAEDGKKMSKKLQNYPDPNVVIAHYGADALRYYLLTSTVTLAEDINFTEKGVQEAMRKVNMLLWNVLQFYELFAGKDTDSHGSESEHVLDKWIMARLNQLIAEMTESMKAYNLPKATRPIAEFIDDLSTWYIRRSRDRFKSDDAADKAAAIATTRHVLIELSKVMAPFTPFLAETVWQKVTGNDLGQAEKSVHLEQWPVGREIDEQAVSAMKAVREVVELGLAKRDEVKIKVRQPLDTLQVTGKKLSDDYLELIKDELNVKKVVFQESDELSVELDTEITPELKLEGTVRELVRTINGLRKAAGMTIQDRAVVYYATASDDVKKVFIDYATELKKDTLSDELVGEEREEMEEMEVNGEKIKLQVTSNK